MEITPPSGSVLDGHQHAAITTPPRHAEAAHVHDRMPVFLPLNRADQEKQDTTGDAQAMLANFQVPYIVIYPFSRCVNKVLEDDAGMLDPNKPEGAG